MRRSTLATVLGAALSGASLIATAAPVSAAAEPAWRCSTVYSATGAHASNQFTVTCIAPTSTNAVYRARLECQSVPPFTQTTYGSWVSSGGATTATCPFPMMAVPGSGRIERS